MTAIPNGGSKISTIWKFAMALVIALGVSTSLNVRQAEAKHQLGAFVAGAIIGGVIAHHVVRHHHKKRYRVVRVKRHHYHHVRPVVTIRVYKHRHHRKHHRHWIRY